MDHFDLQGLIFCIWADFCNPSFIKKNQYSLFYPKLAKIRAWKLQSSASKNMFDKLMKQQKLGEKYPYISKIVMLKISLDKNHVEVGQLAQHRNFL